MKAVLAVVDGRAYFRLMDRRIAETTMVKVQGLKGIVLGSVALLALGSGSALAAKPDGTGKAKAGADSSLPRGLQKKQQRGGQLPPGWERKLKKGEVLDKAVVSQAEPVPEKLKIRLPVGEAGSVDISLGGKIVRLHEATRKVLEVFDMKL